jgi:chorismate dehydratase
VTLRLGHITYSNCFPVHARLLDRPRQGDPLLVEGIPSLLNGLLERGEIDVAPCSSIEYARHADRYRILPELVIGCRGPVHSILLLSSRSPEELDGRTVALPTASATSVVLLKILSRIRWKVAPRWVWFDQALQDPFAQGADAALFIGDVALRTGLHPDRRVRLDLGQEWFLQTGLPFAFAVWQAGGGTREELQALHSRLVESRRYGLEQLGVLAEKYAAEFGLPAPLLEQYWRDLRFELDEEMVEGLRMFYQCAAGTGELPEAPPLRWTATPQKA